MAITYQWGVANLEPIRVVNGEPTDKTKADARVEGGEYQFATLQDGKVTWQLSKYTRGLRVAEEVFINDDLSGLAEVPDMFGRGGRRVQAKGIYGLITGNANVGIDGLPLFHASHNNTGTGTIGNTGWNNAVLKLSTQTDPAGNPLELDPALTLAPAALRGPMQQFLRPNNYMPSQLTGNDFYPSNAIGTNVINYEYTLSGCTFDTTTTVIVNPQPTLDSISPYNPFYQVCEGDSIVTLFTALSNLPGYNEWTFMGTTYQQDDISISFETPGMFPLSVIHYSNGCVSPVQETIITVARCPELLFYVPNSFTPEVPIVPDEPEDPEVLLNAD